MPWAALLNPLIMQNQNNQLPEAININLPEELMNETPSQNIGSKSTKSYNFVNCTGCTINIYEEGKAIEVLRQKEDLETGKQKMIETIVENAMKFVSTFNQDRNEQPQATPTSIFRPKRVRVRPVVKKAPVKKAPAKKATPKKPTRKK